MKNVEKDVLAVKFVLLLGVLPRGIKSVVGWQMVMYRFSRKLQFYYNICGSTNFHIFWILYLFFTLKTNLFPLIYALFFYLLLLFL